MKLSSSEIATCSTCGAALEETSVGDLGCLVCLLRAGLDSEESATQRNLDGRFGPYVVERRGDGSFFELGRGAMGVTYRAIDTSLRRTVALKIIPANVAARSAGARERFMRGARAAAALRQENVATVYHFGIQEDTGECFYAMELIEGETLEERVRRTGPLSVRSTIAIAQQVTDALVAAEKCGLVHRDLKPANLMLIATDADEAEPKVKVIDFGLAKAIKGENDPMWLTQDGFVGTPAFASPEQFDHGSLDVRSDIYSLGVTLWFALTGKTPFAGRSVDEIRRAQRSESLAVDQLRAARVPAWTISLVKSMLAVEPAARPNLDLLSRRLQRGKAKTSRPRSRFVAAAVSLAIMAAAALVFWRSAPPPGPKAAHTEKSLAILPFQNLSREADAIYFVNGIRTQINARLSKVSAQLELVSDSSAVASVGEIDQVAAKLGVGAVLQGTVEKDREKFRIEVRLRDTREHVDLWSQTYERTFSQIAKLESEIAQQVAHKLGVKLTGPETTAINRPTTSNPKAYEAYLKGRHLWLERSADGYRQAKEYFDRAIALDPKYAEAYAGLADVYQFMGAYDFDLPDRKENYRKAQETAQRALQLNPDLPEAHASLGLIAMNYDWDWPLAEKEFQRALALAPNNGLIHDWYAEYARTVGRPEASVALMQRAHELDPFSSLVNSDLGKILYCARLYEDAEKQLKLTLAMDPDFYQPHVWLGYLYVSCRRWDEAIAEFQTLRRKDLSAWAPGFLAYAYGMAGRTAEAKEMLKLMEASYSHGIKIDNLPLAWAYLGVGDKDHALACLEKDIENHATSITALKSFPWFDSLRSDPRFVDLVQRVHLAP